MSDDDICKRIDEWTDVDAFTRDLLLEAKAEIERLRRTAGETGPSFR